jgi:hypothetical protein
MAGSFVPLWSRRASRAIRTKIGDHARPARSARP